jgi:hypothetical protein
MLGAFKKLTVVLCLNTDVRSAFSLPVQSIQNETLFWHHLKKGMHPKVCEYSHNLLHTQPSTVQP